MKSINFLLIAFLVPCLCFMSGCGNKEQNVHEDAPERLIFWICGLPGEVKALTEIAEAYTAETGIQVLPVEIGFFDIQQKLELAAPAGRGPDLLTIPHTRVGCCVLQGLVAPLENLDRKILDDIPEIGLQSFTYNNKLWGVPLTIDAYGLVYNKKLVPEPPHTWGELIQLAKKLTIDKDGDGEIDQYGFLINPNNFFYAYPVYEAFGGYIFGKDKNGNYNPFDIGLNNEGSVAAVNFLVDLRNKHHLIPEAITVVIINDFFGKGKVAMMNLAPNYFNDYKERGVEVGYASYPCLDDGRTGKPLSTLMGYSISKYSKYPRAVKKFLHYLLQPENIEKYYLMGNKQRIMLSKKFNEKPIVKDDELMKKVAEVTLQSTPYPNIPQGDNVWQPMIDAVKLVEAGKSTAREALDQVHKRLSLEIKEMME